MGIDDLIGGVAPRKKPSLDERVLRRNKIHMLTIDERWNSLFSEVPRTQPIEQLEDVLNSKLKEMARLTIERKTNAADKKTLLARIMTLTEEAFTNENAAARREIESCETKVRDINDRAPRITDEMASLDAEVRRLNIKMLEKAVELLYPGIRKAQRRVAELDAELAELRSKLQDRISERESLAATYDSAYQFLHDLLGHEQIEELDKLYSI